MLKIDLYKRETHARLLARGLSDENAVRGTAEWFASGGRQMFVDAFEHETNLKLTALSEGNIVEWGYPKNITEYDKQMAWGHFYRANAAMFLREADMILAPKAVENKLAADSPGVFWRNLRALLEPLFFDSRVLLEHWASRVCRVPGVFGIGKNAWEHPVMLYHSALQCIYGNHSPFATRDTYADSAINHLRVAIELRLRCAFGIFALINKDKAVVPFSFSDLLKRVRNVESKVEFAVPLQHVDRIYRWSNLYMHAGLKLYTWSPMFALQYLTRFLVGGRYGVGKGIKGSVYAGIMTSEQVVNSVQAALKDEVKSSGAELLCMEPSDCHVVFKA